MTDLVTIKNEFDKSIADTAAQGILARVFGDIKTLANPSEVSTEWFNQILDILRFSQDIETGFAHAKGLALALLKQHWNDLPFEARKEHGYDFHTFGCNWTGKARSTVDAYTLTGKIWFLGGYGAGKRIEITERALDGAPIIENGKIKTKMVEFVPYNVDFSKLSIMNSRAQDDLITDKLWEMIVDPFFSCEDLRLENHLQRDPSAKEYVLRYQVIGPGLYASRNGRTVCIAEELNWSEYETDPLVKEAINYFFQVVGLKLDEDLIYKQTHQRHALMVNGD